ncbi:nucleoside triphosphate pyrophosphohydrolase family protein [Flectobacillus sp. DC10W]|uniref:Nucleoside triphosphate pyrophosphohydrolase family protein n=1 Tax=Flectobacillus longus TaxID=2984207 RepID=A0ABT6YIT4_9BACT|nr:nucleoside triphosphate pyrophosphohydrolase family protein [Flectobacillus longus]MDI9863504.1 nucleoside triphosphate pyrophosphohydrolase family protein [Flectobacillus longus]
MEFNEYQEIAIKSDQRKKENDETYRLIPLLGLIGEIGSVAAEHKKRLRDGQSYTTFSEKFKKELGDVLWYISTLAHDMNIPLDDVAKANIDWIKERWGNISFYTSEELYDEKFPEEEKLPREATFEFRQIENNKIGLFLNDKQIGNNLTDNAYELDGYRFHDVFHLSFMANLGWSPVLRKLLGKKRKSDCTIDEVEDGARAAIIEEAISVMVYSHAKDHKFYEDIKVIDYEVLSTIKGMVRNLETKNISTSQWEKAVIDGYTVYRELKLNNGGKVYVNLIKKTIKFLC